jgi:hypothetical protein
MNLEVEVDYNLVFIEVRLSDVTLSLTALLTSLLSVGTVLSNGRCGGETCPITSVTTLQPRLQNFSCVNSSLLCRTSVHAFLWGILHHC